MVNFGSLTDESNNVNGISISSDGFAQMTTECPYTLYSDAPFPPQNCPCLSGDLDPHVIHGSLDPSESSTQTASRSVQLFLQGSLVWQTDQPTDHATRSVTVCRIYICRTALQPNNNTFIRNFNVCMHVTVAMAAVITIWRATLCCIRSKFLRNYCHLQSALTSYAMLACM